MSRIVAKMVDRELSRRVARRSPVFRVDVAEDPRAAEGRAWLQHNVGDAGIAESLVVEADSCRVKDDATIWEPPTFKALFGANVIGDELTLSIAATELLCKRRQRGDPRA